MLADADSLRHERSPSMAAPIMLRAAALRKMQAKEETISKDEKHIGVLIGAIFSLLNTSGRFIIFLLYFRPVSSSAKRQEGKRRGEANTSYHSRTQSSSRTTSGRRSGHCLCSDRWDDALFHDSLVAYQRRLSRRRASATPQPVLSWLFSLLERKLCRRFLWHGARRRRWLDHWGDLQQRRRAAFKVVAKRNAERAIAAL